MKNLICTFLLGSAATAFATDSSAETVSFEPAKIVTSHHELTPNFRWFKHKENGYTYSKYVGGFEYNYERSEGMNFNSFLGYSIYKDKSFFTADWSVKYLIPTGGYATSMSVYPMVGMTNTSHFSTSTNDETFQIYRSAFLGGLGINYNVQDWMTIDTLVSYFKDLSTSCILRKGDEFWGKNYFSPSGFKAALTFRFPHLMSKDIEIGGFYAQTIKKCYKEYGFKTAVAFAF
jgi:hypothetical protein